jgi:hypothetical protein
MGRQAGASTPRSRGAYGSTRGKERQRRKADNRSQQARNQKASEETQAARDALDDLIEEQERNPAVGATEGAMYAARRKLAEEELAKQEKLDIEAAPDDAALPVRSCHKAVALEDHEPHDWERGGLKIKSWCKGYAPSFGFLAPATKAAIKNLPKTGDGEGYWQFAAMTARRMLTQGYNIKYVMEYTGIAASELSHIPLDEDGYGIVVSDEQASRPDSQDEEGEGT